MHTAATTEPRPQRERREEIGKRGVLILIPPPPANETMLRGAARVLLRPSLGLSPPVCACRPFCSGVSEEGKALVQSFLQRASRPKMGKARAKTSAGQRELDLTKQAKNFEGMDLTALLRLNGAKLKELGLPCQERKRLLKYTAKANQGQTLVGRDRKGGTWRERDGIEKGTSPS